MGLQGSLAGLLQQFISAELHAPHLTAQPSISYPKLCLVLSRRSHVVLEPKEKVA